MSSSPPQELSPSALVECLRERGVRLWVDGQDLRYAGPPGALDAGLLAQVRSAKPALLAMLASRRRDDDSNPGQFGIFAGNGGLADAPIARVERRSEMPVSLAQQRFWLLHQLAGQGATYNVPQALVLHGELDVDALQAAMADVVARHEVLRTSFHARVGLPVQVVHGQVDLHMEQVDLRVADPAQALAQARRHVAAAAARPFDLECAPLLRASVLRTGSQEHVLALVLHHIVCDGRSLEVFWADLAQAYASRCALDAPAWSPLQVQYVDYAAHEAARLADAGSARALAWWTATLDGAPPLLELPTDRLRPALPSFAGDLERFRLGPQASTDLRALARSHQATPFMTLLAVLAVVLLRYSGQDEVCLGAPVANRTHPQVQDLIGAFINTVVLRVDGRGNPSFAVLLARVRQAALDAFEHQEVPFEQVVQAVSPERVVAASPLFQVAVSWLQTQASLPRLAGLSATLFEFDHPSVKFDLDLEVHEEADDFLVAWFYSTALFERASMQRMIGHLRRVLAAAAADAGQPIEHIDLLDGDEIRLVTQTWARAAPVAVPYLTVLHGFVAQALAVPQRVAVADGPLHLSYGELAARAQDMALRLADAGVGLGAVVGVLLPPGPELMVALLGVMAAGAAYLPLESRLPAARIRLMLDDAAAAALITAADEPLARELAQGRALLVPSAQGRGALIPAADPARPAYVIYTSGSTGQPKGVVVGHDNLANYIAWAGQAYGQRRDGGPLDMPLFTALAFDLTVTSLFLPLVSGGRIVVYRDEGGVPALFQVFREQQVDLVKLTPAHLAMLGAPDLSLGRIRGLILGGEDLKTAPCRRLVEASAGQVAIFNEYGPTETTVGCMLHRFDPDVDTGASVPIGRPAVGAAIYVLDRAGRPAPVGVAGELYIGGAGVARGYLGQPVLTAERFVPDPWKPGSRMYRSGDQGRWRTDGVLEYLGRRDHQVKIRGHRIELDEIAAAMGADPEVADATAIVMARPVSAAVEPVRHCMRCGLASNYPGLRFDADGVCDTCQAYAANRQRVAGYFRTPADLEAVFERARARGLGRYDCLALVSGGKDSVYMLVRLKEMGLRILAYTLDPGYLSEEAKANIRHMTSLLGIEHRFGGTPHMNEIFVDSLRRHANVCNGCFKTLYTLSFRLAHEEGIPVIATGLSRGQFFETRLSKYYNAPSFDTEQIDRQVLQARKLYHRLGDVVDRRLDNSFLHDDRVFEQIEVVDFYRYVDVSLDELLAHLATLGWRRPSDTGRSTNCLINEAGIFFHKKQRGYHNYALPYAWDVRVGHKTREQSMAELDDEIDEQNVSRMLGEIGWRGPIENEQRAEPLLVGYYVPRGELPPQALRERLALRLPAALVPDVLLPLQSLPLNRNGKVDRAALPPPHLEALDAGREMPRNALERDIAAAWQEALGFGEFGIRDNFFALGGHSLMATRVAAAITARNGMTLPLSALFERPTIAQLAEWLAGQSKAAEASLEDILAEVAAMSDEQARGQLK